MLLNCLIDCLYLIVQLIMSGKVQIFKWGLRVVFCLVIFLVLINMKRSFNLKEEDNLIATERQMDALKGEMIDLEKSASLLKQMSNVCAKYNLKTPLVKRHFLYNAQHRSLYCWIRKIASTSFTKLFSDMSNRRVSHNFYKEVDFLSPKSLRDLQYLATNNTVFKLLIVRHPFQRLVSSYRDRIEDNSRYTAQSWLYARQILYLSRPELFRLNVTGDNILQRIFLTNRRLKVVPSFREFLVWLLEQPPNFDDHWSQYHTHCAVCNTSYNFILKLDEYTFGEVNYVLSKLKLDKSKVYLPKLQRTRAGITNFDITCKYFHNLTTDMILRLYERYKVDFEMYNYKVDKYLPCAKRKN
ncbi:carbohydrate sulfotransferase 11 isoform X2 [Camponotus floridanus]|uniref:carbohydrate sulfotransferase 11 isoform X2 n=1 Tax=Camponotus floridanus TaxID=104421 RepID=UPI00059B5E26|nr:carbohydrate sulfotransferase 11 isoform X2 [Camponotus floridanus]